MHFSSIVFGRVLEGIDRRAFSSIVDGQDGDAYDKTFDSWQHVRALVFAQLSGIDSLRGLEAVWNAHRQHHYHLGGGELRRSTLSDANQRRPVAVFAQLLESLSAQLGRHARKESGQMIRLLDSTPIPLGKLSHWAKSNGRIRGMKAHVLYDPEAEAPRIIDVTHANVNDAQIGRTVAIEPGVTYVFDKGYCHYGWWTAIAKAEAFFVTRPKTRMGLTAILARAVAERQPGQVQADGFVVIQDAEVTFSSKGDSKLPIRLRCITIRRQDHSRTPAEKPAKSDLITLLTNDMTRPAFEVGALYKRRWQIELLFRWIKQHLKIRKFLGHSENAVKLQVLAAMIAFVLIRIAARKYRATHTILRFAGLVSQCLFERRDLARIEKPPPVNPSVRLSKTNPNQIAFQYV